MYQSLEKQKRKNRKGFRGHLKGLILEIDQQKLEEMKEQDMNKGEEMTQMKRINIEGEMLEAMETEREDQEVEGDRIKMIKDPGEIIMIREDKIIENLKEQDKVTEEIGHHTVQLQVLPPHHSCLSELILNFK